jgi:hypothetical protein
MLRYADVQSVRQELRHACVSTSDMQSVHAHLSLYAVPALPRVRVSVRVCMCQAYQLLTCYTPAADKLFTSC